MLKILVSHGAACTVCFFCLAVPPGGHYSERLVSEEEFWQYDALSRHICCSDC